MQGSLFSVRCLVFSVRFSVCRVKLIMYSAFQCSFDGPLCFLMLSQGRMAVCSGLCAVFSVQCSVCSVQCEVCCVQCECKLFPMSFALYSIHCSVSLFCLTLLHSWYFTPPLFPPSLHPSLPVYLPASPPQTLAGIPRGSLEEVWEKSVRSLPHDCCLLYLVYLHRRSEVKIKIGSVLWELMPWQTWFCNS